MAAGGRVLELAARHDGSLRQTATTALPPGVIVTAMARSGKGDAFLDPAHERVPCIAGARSSGRAAVGPSRRASRAGVTDEGRRS